jgi:putative addiction module component (TIGR02574 family)
MGLRALAQSQAVDIVESVTQAVAQILQAVEDLSAPERAELADRLVEALTRDIPPEIERAHLDEVRRRITEVESGAVTLIPGDQVFAEARRIVEAARRAS